MKKILYSTIALLLLLCFVACNDDDNNGTRSQSPAEAAEGVYIGTWYEYTDETGTELKDEYDGKVTLEKSDKYVSTITTECPDFEDPVGNVTAEDIIEDKEGVVNISWSGNGFIFGSSAGGGGTMAYKEVEPGTSKGLYKGPAGKIESETMTTGVLTYMVSKRVGRKVETFQYFLKFVGKKALEE